MEIRSSTAEYKFQWAECQTRDEANNSSEQWRSVLEVNFLWTVEVRANQAVVATRIFQKSPMPHWCIRLCADSVARATEVSSDPQLISLDSTDKVTISTCNLVPCSSKSLYECIQIKYPYLQSPSYRNSILDILFSYKIDQSRSNLQRVLWFGHESIGCTLVWNNDHSVFALLCFVWSRCTKLYVGDGQLISMFLNFEDQPSATTHRCFSESFFTFYYFSPSNSSLTPNLLMNTVL